MMPVHTPALKMPPTISQLDKVMEMCAMIKRDMLLFICFFFYGITYCAERQNGAVMGPA